jgi:hypothetical protein
MGTIRFEKMFIIVEDVEGQMSTLPRQVAEVECGAKKVACKTPVVLGMSRDQVEAKITVFGLAMSS